MCSTEDHFYILNHLFVKNTHFSSLFVTITSLVFLESCHCLLPMGVPLCTITKCLVPSCTTIEFSFQLRSKDLVVLLKYLEENAKPLFGWRFSGSGLVLSPGHTLYASSKRGSGVISIDFIRLEAISLHENRRLKSDWPLLNNYIILTYRGS